VVVAALALGRLFRSRPPVAAVSYAVGAATCFGLTSGTVRAVWLRHATPPAVAIGLSSAVVGIALAQQAYRDGGLGAPLATLTLVDPLSAGALGVLILGETLDLRPAHLTLAVSGGVATVLGVVLLSQRRLLAQTAGPLPSAAGRSPEITPPDIVDRLHLQAPTGTDHPGS
jgi:drug/metabolite transporter (DMT)-like permease